MVYNKMCTIDIYSRRYIFIVATTQKIRKGQHHRGNCDMQKEESMNESVLDLITPRLTEQLGEIYEQNGEYQRLTEQENKLLEQLNGDLSKEQIEMLNRYLTAVNSTYAACEKIAYQQGMRDCASFFTCLVVR